MIPYFLWTLFDFLRSSLTTTTYKVFVNWIVIIFFSVLTINLFSISYLLPILWIFFQTFNIIYKSMYIIYCWKISSVRFGNCWPWLFYVRLIAVHNRYTSITSIQMLIITSTLALVWPHYLSEITFLRIKFPFSMGIRVPWWVNIIPKGKSSGKLSMLTRCIRFPPLGLQHQLK